MDILIKNSVDQLLNRLEINIDENVQSLEKKLTTLRLGMIGENRLAKVFEYYQFPFSNQILYGVSLEAGGKFQTDCLILTTNVIFLLESKNIGGKLSFEKNPERLVSEKDNGQIAVYESPEVQVERNMIQLKWWLEERGLQIPVVGAFVFTSAVHPTIVKGPERIQALFPKTIFVYINRQWEYFREKTNYLSSTELKKLSELIRVESVKKRFKQYPLKKSLHLENINIKKGVRCENCGQVGMKWHHGNWICISCNHKDRDAHIAAIQEWFLFYKETITNRECQEYLLINDRHLIKRLLKHENILEFGNTKGAYYKWNW